MKGSRLLYITGISSIGISTLIMMGRPLVITYILDTILGGKETALPDWYARILEAPVWEGIQGRLIWSAAVFLILTALGGYFMYQQAILTARAAEKTALQVRNRLYRKLQHTSFEYHVKAETGDIMQRCTSDVETVRVFFASQLTEIGRALFILSITSFIMVTLDLRMMLVSVVLMPAIFLFSFYRKKNEGFRNST